MVPKLTTPTLNPRSTHSSASRIWPRCHPGGPESAVLDSSACAVRVVYGRIMARNVDDSFVHYMVAAWVLRNGTNTQNPNPKPQVYALVGYENLATMSSHRVLPSGKEPPPHLALGPHTFLSHPHLALNPHIFISRPPLAQQ